MFKIAATVTSVLVSLGLAAFYPAQPPGDDEPPAKEKRKDDLKARKKERDERKKERDEAKKERDEAKKERDEAKKKDGPGGPAGDLHRAYDLLRRLRAEGGSGTRSDERLRDWTERSVRYYKDGVKAFRDGDERLAHEYGAIAHDLARAVDHARNAARADQTDPDLPAPPDGNGPDDAAGRVRRELRRVHERITDQAEGTPREAEFYVQAAKEYYNAARRDAEANRNDRAGELVRAADALTHVAEHVGHVVNKPDGPEAKEKRDRPDEKEKRDRPEPKEKRDRDRDRERDGDPAPPRF